MRKLALPGVPHRWFALPLRGMDEEEGLHSRLKNWAKIMLLGEHIPQETYLI